MSVLGPEDELAHAAKRHRARASKETVASGREGVLRSERDEANSMVEKALGGDGRADFQALDYLAVIIGMALPVGLAALTFGLDNLLVDLALAIAGLALSFAVLGFRTRLAAKLRRRAVREFGHGFDPDFYIADLSKKRREGTLVVSVLVKVAVSEAARETVCDALAEWLPGFPIIKFEGRSLHLESKSLATTAMWQSKYSSGRYFTNQPLHELFAKFMKVAPRIDAAHAIERIQVDVRGEVLPMTASAERG